MSESLFAPFRGERFADPTTLGRRLAPPYDVIGPEQRAALAAQDPANLVHVDLPVAAEDRDPYGEAAALLESWRAGGILARDREPSAYVLRTTSRLEDGSASSRTGVFLAVAAEPFSARRVLPHERTHRGPKEDRRRLTLATGCNLSPVFLLAPDPSGELSRLLERVTAEAPWAFVQAVGAKQEVWVALADRALELAAAAGTTPAYIADGHHRYETAVMLRDEAPAQWRSGAARTLAHVVSFRDPGLRILATHRVVEGRPLERGAVLKAASPYFARALPGQSPTLRVAFADGSEAAMVLRAEADLSRATDLPAHPAVRALPVTVADAVFLRVVVAPLMGGVPSLRYTPSKEEACAAFGLGDVAVVLLLPPTRLEEVKQVADAGQVMPPKSTFFAPKVPTGVVLRPLDDEV